MDTLDSVVTTGGTLSYMSPEVLRGEPGDHRSDLWALGVMLYEASAGHVPFHGRTTFELSSAILNEPPPPLPARIPPGLAGIIQRCLAKEPALRYQRASELQAALEAIQSASAVPEPSDQRGSRTTTVHRGIKHLKVSNGDVLLLIGTMKGVFLLRSSEQRARWDVAGPYFHGKPHMRWPTTAGKGGTVCGLRPPACFGARFCAPATTTEGPGPIRRRRPFDFPQTRALHSKTSGKFAPDGQRSRT